MGAVLLVLFLGMIGLPFSPASGSLGLLRMLWWVCGCSFWFLILLGALAVWARRGRTGAPRRAPRAVAAALGLLAAILGAAAVLFGGILAADALSGPRTLSGVRCTAIESGGRGTGQEAVLLLADGGTTRVRMSLIPYRTDRDLRRACRADAPFSVEMWERSGTVRRVIPEG